MIYEYIKGILTELTPSKATVETHGIGYSIFIPVSGFAKLLSLKGHTVCLFLSFVVREDTQRLFGFLEKQEKEVFEKLSDVSGIGPKTALAIIGHLSLEELEHALHEQDTLTLSKVPGIGKKTAERLIIDMKDKLKNLKPLTHQDTLLSKEQLGLMADALAALTHLGYQQTLAQTAIKKILRSSKGHLQLSELITLSLKALHAS